MSRILIIGGSDAGINAGSRAGQLGPSSQISIVLADSFPNFSICSLPFYVSGETPDWHDLANRNYEELASQGLELLLDRQAVPIDAAAKVVALVDRQIAGRSQGNDNNFHDYVLSNGQFQTTTILVRSRPRLGCSVTSVASTTSAMLQAISAVPHRASSIALEICMAFCSAAAPSFF